MAVPLTQKTFQPIQYFSKVSATVGIMQFAEEEGEKINFDYAREDKYFNFLITNFWD